MRPVSLPPHIAKLCYDWHREHDDIFKMWNGVEFDPAGVILAVERRKKEIKHVFYSDPQKDKHIEQKRHFEELNKLKRYVMNLVQVANSMQNAVENHGN